MMGKNMKKYIFPSDYDTFFSERFVIITGVSRSGTSILGKIIGSMENAIYLYEPVIMSLLPGLIKTGFADLEQAGKFLKATLFEDYYLQALHGRSVNFKKSDESYVGNYQDIATIRARWKKHDRRIDILQDIRKGKYLFVLKVNEIQHLLPVMGSIFKGVKVVHIIRNGNDVISSSLGRGWYSDEDLNNNVIDWARPGCPKIPWYILQRDAGKFAGWNAETRIAYMWRFFVKMGMGYSVNKKKYLEIRYEDLVDKPGTVADKCARFVNSRKTAITLKNIGAVKKHALSRHRNLCGKIDIEERVRFQDLMRELKY